MAYFILRESKRDNIGGMLTDDVVVGTLLDEEDVDDSSNMRI